MLRNFFLTSIRNLLKNKLNSLIGLLGLVLAHTIFIIIIQNNYFENSFDVFHTNSKNIYRIVDDFTLEANGETQTMATTYFGVYPTLENEIAYIEKSSKTFNLEGILKYDDNIFNEENLVFATPSYFQMFDYDLEGSIEEFRNPNTIIISQNLATKYFGKQSPIGQVIEVLGVFEQDFSAKVVGVFEELPKNTNLNGEAFLSMAWLEYAARNLNVLGEGIDFEAVIWRWVAFQNYIQVEDGVTKKQMDSDIAKVVNKYRNELNTRLKQTHDYKAQLINEVHVTPNLQFEPKPTLDPFYLSIFYVVGALILVIAWINYINISTARANNRAKEVGMRKVFSASRMQLIGQFVLEAFVLNCLAVIISIVMTALLVLPIENALGQSIFDNYDQNPALYAFLFVTVCVGTIITGGYPALIMSNFKTTLVLKGKFNHSKYGNLLRKILVVVQLFFAIALLTSAIIINSQINYMMSKDLGIELTNVMVFQTSTSQNNNQLFSERMQALKRELKKLSFVESVSFSSLVPGVENLFRNTSEIQNGGITGTVMVNRGAIDDDFTKLYSIEIVEGRGYSELFTSDESSIILNQKATKDFGFSKTSEAIGKMVVFPGNQRFEIVGIFKDFHQRGVQSAIESMAIQKDSLNNGPWVSVRCNSPLKNDFVQETQRLFKTFFQNTPFQAQNLELLFEKQYSEDKKFKTLIFIFTIIVILISCLGIVGLSTYWVQQKSKEISIRKVLGAKLGSIFYLLNKEYLKLGFISSMLSIPIVVYFMNKWLNNYVDRIEFRIVHFLLPIMLVLVIILVITAKQTYKVATIDPSKTLKED